MGKLICCKCKVTIKESPNIKGESHGYCDKCFAEAQAEVTQFIASRRKQKEAVSRE